MIIEFGGISKLSRASLTSSNLTGLCHVFLNSTESLRPISGRTINCNLPAQLDVVKMSGWEVGTPHRCTGMVRARARGRPIVVVHGAVCEGSGSARTICGRPS